jgi:hypothetical protein
MTLIAKPIIDRKYWILQDDDHRKVGNVEACDGGYQVKINNQIQQYKTIRMVEQRVQIVFEPPVKSAPKQSTNTVHGYPVSGRLYNPLWDVQKKLPLYTKTNKSKSWFAAGWYRVKKGRNWQVVQGPKLILLQRYQYTGPFYSQEEATQNECTLTKVH